MDQETISVQMISYLTIFASPSFNLWPPCRIGSKWRSLLAGDAEFQIRLPAGSST
jgi:hypothetical protein